ncbi:OTU-like cysteine protease [Ancylostoma ceylanicum]|uniref:OTU-like cysteine protease n=1 Tax=Ancylostoma ceylanicum TaxID=53326 RepID=A0A0D6L997_9BILA|nr:OTU-like cysteine protease [Ancylostoma ceylanicum]
MAESAASADDEFEGECDPMEALLAKHRKEKKALKEKTLSMKKTAKSGNKLKQKETNAEIERLEAELAARHEREIADLKSSAHAEPSAGADVSSEHAKGELDGLEQSFYKEVQAKKEEAVRRMQEAMQKDRENAASSLRVTEMAAIQKILDERGLSLVDIAPDGDCLYNAVANQLSRVKGYEQVTGKDMRRRAAKYIRENKDDFIPFLTNESDDPLDEIEFEKYCYGVENESKDGGVWGGEPELNALSQSLERTIELIQPIGPPVIFGENYKKTKPLIIVYHRHAYQLGAHYNSTAVKTMA